MPFEAKLGATSPCLILKADLLLLLINMKEKCFYSTMQSFILDSFVHDTILSFFLRSFFHLFVFSFIIFPFKVYSLQFYGFIYIYISITNYWNYNLQYQRIA